jgi:FlaA1/EpsC-like NDP-sugar epimerase
MTAAEAVALVFRADRIARSPEVFWLDMGRPVRLGDLVSRLVAIEHELGFPSVPIDVIGLRPGEKRNETLVDPRLTFARTVDRRIRVARDRAARRVDGRRVVHALHRAGVTADAARTLAILELDVHGFAPSAEARRLAIRSAAVRLVDAREGRRRSGKRSSAA